MEKGTNNNDINKSGQLTKNQVFFMQKWLELLNVNTHSKYSVKFLNTHQALKELVFICESMVNGQIKKNTEHLNLVFKEAFELIEKDWLLKTKEENFHKILVGRLQTTINISKETETPKVFSIIYQVNYILKQIEGKYLKWIIQELSALLTENEEASEERLKKIDYLTGVLVSELIAQGWSQQRLYDLIKKDFLTSESSDETKWQHFVQEISKEKETYVCFLHFEFKPSEALQSLMRQVGLDVVSGKEIVDTYVGGLLNSHVKQEDIFIRVTAQAYDYHSAVDESWKKITETHDVLRFYGYHAIKIEKKAIVIDPNGTHFYRNIEGSSIMNKKGYRASLRTLELMNEQLGKGNQEEVNRKLKSILEFSRLSEEALSPQAAFINLWIALESFVETKESEGGIENVKKNVSAASCHNYLFTVIKTLMKDFERCQITWEELGGSDLQGRKREYQFVGCMLNEQISEQLITKCEDKNYLLAYRCKQIKEVIKSGKKSSKMIIDHQTNVKRHLQRLYRIRNGIVHSGNTPYNSNLFIRHLREYIESVVSVVVYRLSKHEFVYTEEVLSMMRDSVDYTAEVLSSINPDTMDKAEYQNLLLNSVF